MKNWERGCPWAADFGKYTTLFIAFRAFSASFWTYLFTLIARALKQIEAAKRTRPRVHDLLRLVSRLASEIVASIPDRIL